MNQKGREKVQSHRRNFKFRQVKYISIECLLNVNVNYDSKK